METGLCNSKGHKKIATYIRDYRRSGNFRCKNIFVVCVNHENKKHEIYFTTDSHYSRHIFAHTFSQHS